MLGSLLKTEKSDSRIIIENFFHKSQPIQRGRSSLRCSFLRMEWLTQLLTTSKFPKSFYSTSDP